MDKQQVTRLRNLAQELLHLETFKTKTIYRMYEGHLIRWHAISGWEWRGGFAKNQNALYESEPDPQRPLVNIMLRRKVGVADYYEVDEIRRQVRVGEFPTLLPALEAAMRALFAGAGGKLLP